MSPQSMAESVVFRASRALVAYSAWEKRKCQTFRRNFTEFLRITAYVTLRWVNHLFHRTLFKQTIFDFTHRRCAHFRSIIQDLFWIYSPSHFDRFFQLPTTTLAWRIQSTYTSESISVPMITHNRMVHKCWIECDGCEQAFFSCNKKPGQKEKDNNCCVLFDVTIRKSWHFILPLISNLYALVGCRNEILGQLMIR